ncbi:MAG: hypothetical protein V2A76_19390 [Planctomycetota bacterium]
MRTPMTGLCFLLSLTSVAYSQQVRRESVVTPDGVFTVEQTRWALLSPEPVTPPWSNPNPSLPSVRWRYPNPLATPWITESVGIGNFGTMDWLGQNLNGERVSLLAPTEFPLSASPIYEDPDLTGSSISIQVAAADKAPACAVAWRNTTTGANEIRYYSGYSATPLVHLGANVEEIRISDDGTRVAAGYTDASGDAAVDMFDENVAYLTTLVGAGSSFRHHDISGDGSTVLIASGTTDFVYDVATGSLLHQDASTVSTDAHSIDNDGDTWGRGGFDVGVWKDSGGTYSRILTFSDTSFGFGIYDACDVSADGTTFAVAGRDATTTAHFRVYCWSLSSTSATLLWTFDCAGTGSYQDVGQEVSISDDGKLIAVGSWGDEFDAHPEVMVFDRATGNIVHSVDTRGSCYSVDMSGDGQFVVVGAKAVHANVFGDGGDGYSLDNGGQGFFLAGTPSIGRTCTLAFRGAPSDPVWMSASLGLRPTGIPIHGYSGLWWLDPTLTLIPVGFIGYLSSPGGTLPALVTLPPNPGLVGLTVFAQTARSGPVKEIDNYLRLTITQ